MNMPGNPQIAPQNASDSKTITGSMFRLSPCMRGRMTLPTTMVIAHRPASRSAAWP